MTCWAFFESNTGVETLKDHIDVGLQHIEERYIRRNYHLYVAREFDVSKEDAERLLTLTYILHDSGKGLEEYQIRKTSFGGHQEFSAAIAYNVLDDFDDNLRRVVVNAIMLHHHDWVRRGSISIRKPVLNDECRSLLSDYLNRPVPKTVPSLPGTILDETLTSNLKRVYILLVPLMVADNYAAIMNRENKGSGSLLGDEVIKSYNVYKGVFGDC